jgi:hypothetical protein
MRRRYVGVVLFVATVASVAALARSEAGQRAWDVAVWRAMVTFKLPVQSVDDFHRRPQSRTSVVFV